jgi:CheY-like chemotaxis protein
VVLVDDHPSVLRALGRLLEPTCEIVASVDNGQKAIEAAVRLKPDIMVADLMMPEMDGLALCRRVKEVAPEMDVIILTAFDDGQIEKVALDAGASAFVAKHTASGALQDMIQSLAEKKQSGR